MAAGRIDNSNPQFIYRFFDDNIGGIPGCRGQAGRPISEVRDTAGTILVAESPVCSNVLSNNNSYVGGPEGPTTRLADGYQRHSANVGGCGRDLVRISHNEGWNYVFADGHAKWHRPEQTIGTGTMTDPRGLWTIAEND